MLCIQAVERGAGMDGQKITYTLIKHRLGDLFYRLVYVLVLMHSVDRCMLSIQSYNFSLLSEGGR